MLDLRPQGSRLSRQMKTLLRYEGVCTSHFRYYAAINSRNAEYTALSFMAFLSCCQKKFDARAALIFPGDLMPGKQVLLH